MVTLVCLEGTAGGTFSSIGGGFWFGVNLLWGGLCRRRWHLLVGIDLLRRGLGHRTSRGGQSEQSLGRRC